MAGSHRIFTSFAMEDVRLRDFLVGQARNERSPFSFVDMAVKEPWDEAWKTNCRARIRGCDGMIGIITRNTPAASGQLWELQCAYAEGIPVRLIYGYQDDRPTNLPEPVRGRMVYAWSWDNIVSFLASL
jgi:hypothetical protein